MPFESKAQRRWMWANKPEMAREWQSHTHGRLPERKRKGPHRKKAVKRAIRRQFER